MERVMVKSRRRPGGGVGAVLVAWTCLTVAMAVPAGAATGGIGGRPANPDPNNPRTESIFIYTLDKGASKQDQVLVSNGSSETKTVELYTVDGVVKPIFLLFDNDFTALIVTEYVASVNVALP